MATSRSCGMFLRISFTTLPKEVGSKGRQHYHSLPSIGDRCGSSDVAVSRLLHEHDGAKILGLPIWVMHGFYSCRELSLAQRANLAKLAHNATVAQGSPAVLPVAHLR